MRIECITAETDRYLPVLFISEENKLSEVSETVEQDASTSTATEESDTTVKEEDVMSVMENDDTCDKVSEVESTDNFEHKEGGKNGTSNVKPDSIDETSTTLVKEDNNVVNDDHETEKAIPEEKGDVDIVSDSEEKTGEDVEDATEESVVVEAIDNDSIFRSEDEDTYASSLFRNDRYEEEYGDMVAPRIQKMKKTTASAKKPLKKNPTIEKQKPIFAEPAGIVSQSNVINHHFEKNGFLVVESSKPHTIDGLKKLTYQIGENYPYTAPLLKEVRKSICTPNAKGDRNICFKFDKTAGSFYHQFCNKMKHYGLFTKYFINGNVLTATISSVPRVISYLNGQWLEMYASFILEDVVNEYSKTNGYEYEILTNVKVTNITSGHAYAHEVDCVISIGDKCFAFEMKSGGQFDDYSGLYKTRKELRFVPDRYLLLSTELDEDLAEVLQYFYEFYITGMTGFKSRFVEMINKAFAN